MAKQFTEPTEATFTVTAITFSKPSQFSEDKNFMILATRERVKLLGEAEPGSIILNCEYRFSGNRDDSDQWGPQFRFKNFAIREPSTRSGVVAYLTKYCPGIGSIIAGRLCDSFGNDRAIGILRSDPQAAAKAVGLSIERASQCSEVLKRMEKFEDTRVGLMDLFKGRRFRQNLPDLLIKRYGSAAESTVRANPFVLIEDRYPGCGFLLVDELYKSLGHDPSAMIRQVHALAHTLREIKDGSTWARRSDVYSDVAKKIDSGLRFSDAVAEAYEQNRIAVRTEKGESWYAEKGLADQEAVIAEMLCLIGGKELMGEPDAASGTIEPNEPEESPLDDLFGDLESESEADAEPVLAHSAGEIHIGDVLQSAFDELKPAKPDIREIRQSLPPQPKDQSEDFGFDFGLEFIADASGMNEDYETATELIEELDRLTEELQNCDIPAADSFLEGVVESLAGISEHIEKRKSATKKQIAALKNMIEKTQNWIENAEKAESW